jgi:hypothetical protein
LVLKRIRVGLDGAQFGDELNLPSAAPGVVDRRLESVLSGRLGFDVVMRRIPLHVVVGRLLVLAPSMCSLVVSGSDASSIVLRRRRRELCDHGMNRRRMLATAPTEAAALP